MVKLIESLRKYCAKPLDQFESKEDAIQRSRRGLAPVNFDFRIQALLYKEASTGGLQRPADTGGKLWHSVHYDIEKQQLRVDFPYYEGGTHRLVKTQIFKDAKEPPKNYDFVEVGETMKWLPNYVATNAFGANIEVQYNRVTGYLLAITDADDLLRIARPTTRDHSTPSIQISANPSQARALAQQGIEWKIEGKVFTYPGAACVVDKIEYTNRKPTFENPWHEDYIEYVLPIKLTAVSLLNSANGDVLWSAGTFEKPQ